MVIHRRGRISTTFPQEYVDKMWIFHTKLILKCFTERIGFFAVTKRREARRYVKYVERSEAKPERKRHMYDAFR